MNLNFMKVFPDGSGTLSGKETHFKEKIFKSFNYPLYAEIVEDFEIDTYIIMMVKQKKHTIRFLTDPQAEKWKKENRKIHFRQWKDKPYRSKNLLFAPVVPVKSLQEIDIYFVRGAFALKIDIIEVELKRLNDIEIETLAVNDGFESINDFFQYFTPERIKAAEKENKHPYIIHWTDLKY